MEELAASTTMAGATADDDGEEGRPSKPPATTRRESDEGGEGEEPGATTTTPGEAAVAPGGAADAAADARRGGAPPTTTRNPAPREVLVVGGTDAWDRTAASLLALHGADLAPYLGQFRDVGGRGGIFEEEVGYERMLAMWNVRGNAVHLAVGGPLQPPTVDADDGRWGGKYPFIASLYREARRVLAEEGGGFRLAKVLVLTAGLFEQCRVMEFRLILQLLFSGPAATFGEVTKEALPFMYCAQACTSSEEALKCWADQWEWEKEADSLAKREPLLQINFQNIYDTEPHPIALNPLITFERVLSYRGGAWRAGGRDIRPEFARIVLRRRGRLVRVTYVPYARLRCLSILEAGDTLVVEDVRSDSDKINKHLLHATNANFDPSINHWMQNAFAALHEKTRAVPKGDFPSLLRVVVKYWSGVAGGVKFLCADTHAVSSFLKLNSGADAGILSGDYIRVCYENARSNLKKKVNFEEGWSNIAKGFMLTAGLMEQGQFTPIGELLELYSKEGFDEKAMGDLHPWLHDSYAQLNDLKRYLANVDLDARRKKIEGQSFCVHLRFFHVQSSQHHDADINPLITLETLVGIHTLSSNFSYESVGITTDDGRTIPFASSRKKTLAELMIMHKSVLTVEDMALRREAPWRPEADTSNELWEATSTLVNGHAKNSLARMKPEYQQRLGVGGSMLFVISRYFFPQRSKLLSADEMEKPEGDVFYPKLYGMAKIFAEAGAVMEAKLVVLIGALIEQCQIFGVHMVQAAMSPEVFLCPTMSLKSTLETCLPLCYARCVLVEDQNALMNFLCNFDAYKHINELRGKEPRISICFSNRIQGKDYKVLKSLNSHVTFQYFVKKYSIRKRSLQSLLINHNGFVLFITTVGKRTLGQIGWKDDDVIVFEDQANNRALTNTTSGQRKRSANPKKKNKKQGRVKQKNKPRKQIVIPQTEEDLRNEHSKRMSPVLEQLEREKLRKIRQNLNNLSIKKTKVKDRKPIRIQVVPNPVVNPPTEALEGKAGKVVHPVIVGNSEHLYKSSKKSAKSRKPPHLRIIDLHGCTAYEAIAKLEEQLPAWTDAAMKEESFTIPVDIVCGGGNQILSEAVEQWIRKNRQVANRPKGFI